jgi:hypothetical protein
MESRSHATQERMNKVNLSEKLARFTAHWPSERTVEQLERI